MPNSPDDPQVQEAVKAADHYTSQAKAAARLDRPVDSQAMATLALAAEVRAARLQLAPLLERLVESVETIEQKR
ncbi:hypothetical protein GCM10009609_59220 [Pseudonocardia aurantiaca]|uniref:Uncharacterized protein n=1 Tax=Pseudonocardia aurantiaca TaxID=75290 RepID=A0ABW4FUR4_9PSEU